MLYDYNEFNTSNFKLIIYNNNIYIYYVKFDLKCNLNVHNFIGILVQRKHSYELN